MSPAWFSLIHKYKHTYFNKYILLRMCRYYCSDIYHHFRLLKTIFKIIRNIFSLVNIEWRTTCSDTMYLNAVYSLSFSLKYYFYYISYYDVCEAALQHWKLWKPHYKSNWIELLRLLFIHRCVIYVICLSLLVQFHCQTHRSIVISVL